MKSLFNTEHVNEFIARVNKLTPESRPLWGKMNVSQMLEHCIQPLRMAHGEIKSKRGLIGFLFGKMAKKKYVGGADFEKNLPTDPNFIIAKPRDFEKNKQELIAKLKDFAAKGPEAISKDKHPFFGEMSPQEWDIIQSKHLDHHLKQFGV